MEEILFTAVDLVLTSPSPHDTDLRIGKRELIQVRLGLGHRPHYVICHTPSIRLIGKYRIYGEGEPMMPHGISRAPQPLSISMLRAKLPPDFRRTSSLLPNQPPLPGRLNNLFPLGPAHNAFASQSREMRLGQNLS